jgi:hypothetical protein
MKRIIAILCLCLLLTGCGTSYKDAVSVSETIGGGYFTQIKIWDDSEAFYRIVYANDTKVKYLIWKNGYQGGITPLYNADGSLQVYKGE